MACAPCEARRKAAMEAAKSGQVAETVKQVALGAAEMLGLKAKEPQPEGMATLPHGYIPRVPTEVVDAKNIKRY